MAQTIYVSGGDVRTIRLGLGMTQEDVAEYLGVTSRTISEWERHPAAAVPNPRLAHRIYRMKDWEPKWMGGAA